MISTESSRDINTLTSTFKNWVTDELNAVDPVQRQDLKGIYLFLIDKEPRFVVYLHEYQASSLQIPTDITLEKLKNVLSEDYRVRIRTDSKTLERLLLGTLRAKLAFLTGRVKIDGDLLAFIRLISLLKKRGVKP